MLRSKKIRLVLITAALASCNRIVIPSRSAEGYVPDPTLTQAPAEVDESPGDCVCRVDNRDSVRTDSQVIYTPGHIYRKGAFWRNQWFVARGGFGKSSHSVAS